MAAGAEGEKEKGLKVIRQTGGSRRRTGRTTRRRRREGGWKGGRGGGQGGGEIQFMKTILLYEEASEEECWRVTGKRPIATKWVDINKGTEEEQEVRCRLVARDFKPKGEKEREDLFAATPPFEAKKLLFRMASGQVGATGTECVKLMFIDVKTAHLNGVVGDGVNV